MTTAGGRVLRTAGGVTARRGAVGMLMRLPWATAVKALP